jgi:hypothetical protein
MAKYAVRIELIGVPKDQPGSRLLYDKLRKVMQEHGYNHAPPTGEYINPNESDDLTIDQVARAIKVLIKGFHTPGSKGTLTRGDTVSW